MENLENELEHVHALHDEKHQEVLRLQDNQGGGGGGEANDDDDNNLALVYSG